jgi:predicted AlkP superfamily phosphohydrolase/phosphomutase
MLSDHGFGPRRTLFHVDEWLAGLGLLRFAGGKAGLRRFLKPYMRTLKRLIPRGLLRRGRQAFAVSRVIDWAHTRAYSGVSSEYGIYVNLAGREPYGTVTFGAEYDWVRGRIKQELLRVREPRTGQLIVTAAHDREEYHAGPYVDQAPDIVFELAPGYEPSSEVSARGVFSDVAAEGEGMHQPQGIFLASGTGIITGQLEQPLALADLAPTIFHALALPVPTGLDGRVVEEIFTPAFLDAHPVVTDTGTNAGPPDASAPVYTAEEEALLEERLQALGYLS